MRLLRSKDLTFHLAEELPKSTKYAILSHTWGEDEVTYKEIKKHPDKAIAKGGYKKIKAFAQVALANGFEYVWVDTCCIDKTSSAELSEAINSMFRLYREAAVCYAFLEDVPARVNHPAWIGRLQASRWFTRGWTLQELIAPRLLEMYAQDWTSIGTKKTLAPCIHTRTGIPQDVIIGGDFSNTSIAQRMSWSAGRSTERKEDEAYCLMGLFNVNMPMLYGEGERAFSRLQEEIIKSSDDMSIFAWVNPKASFSAYRGLFAHSPAEFAESNDISWVRGMSSEPYQSTNKGIRITLPLMPRESRSQELIAPLQGVYKKHNIKLGIFLQKVGEGQYARVETNELALHSGGIGALTSCFVRQIISMESASHSRAAGIFLRVDPDFLELLNAEPRTCWDVHTKTLRFNAPVALQNPPVAVFTLQPLHVDDQSVLTIIIDANQPWGCSLQIGKGWNTAPIVSQFIHKIHCRKPRQPVVEVLMERGVFDGEAKLTLSAVVLSDDEGDSPPFHPQHW